MHGMSSYVATAPAICCLGTFAQFGSVQALILQGSTTFNASLIEAMQRRVAGAQ